MSRNKIAIKNGWSRRTVSTAFYLFVASHNARSLLLNCLLLLLRQSYLPEPRRIVLYLDEPFSLDARDDACQLIRCPLEVDEEDLKRALSRVVCLVEYLDAVDLVVVDDVVENLGDLLFSAAVKSVSDAERRNSGSSGGRHC